MIDIAYVFWYSNYYSCFNHFVCLRALKLHDLCRETWRKPENTVYLSTFTNFCVVSYSGADLIAVYSNHFLRLEKLSGAKILLTGQAVAQNIVFEFFNRKQLETIPMAIWSDKLKKQLSWKSFSILEQTSLTWHKNLTAWLRSVTLIQSPLVIKPIFSHNLPSIYI